ncbi:MAG: putative toxin-antitoxin system toxin component, PIN family [Leptolyngbyaceae bacterium]|nr:putative toxin-antitoxin system toxin component, PIN family [Leptolyngbyaceae bacterium]
MNFCPRTVIDTNIVVSTLVFGGSISRLRFAWQANRLTPLISKATTTELMRVLAYPKFKLTPTEQEDLLSDYLLFCEVVVIPNRLPVIPECRDPFDVPFLLLALAGRADYLVTGDRDLLSLKEDFSCPIVTVEDFLKVIDHQSP